MSINFKGGLRAPRANLAVTALGASLAGLIAAQAASAAEAPTPGNLLVSRVIYDNKASNVTVGQPLPPGCTSGCVSAVANGTYPFVFNNAPVDGSFGITSKITLDQITPAGVYINTYEVPNSAMKGVKAETDQMVSSFSSKSEVALNLSSDKSRVSFMGYLAPIDAIDVSNSNTPGVIDPTNPVISTYYRVVADFNFNGDFFFTATNAYSGNNGRAAISYVCRTVRTCM